MRFLLRMLGVGVCASAVAVACGGTEFSTVDEAGGSAGSGQGGKSAASGKGGSGGSSDAGGAGDTSVGGSSATGGSSGSGTGAVAGTAGGGTTLCTEASECDDEKPCTLDVCNESGVCENPNKCADDELCCDGECGQCCQDSDCNDDVECTTDECFAGFCSNTPGTCEADTDYCSPTAGCVPREECNADSDCEDDDPCTTVTCVDGLCNPVICPDGGGCCPGLGCGSCCSDSQCPHDNPCEPSVCGEDLECQKTPLCADNELCCASSDAKTAVCGTCCSADDCQRDMIDCTIEKCKLTAGGTSACFVDLDPSVCEHGQTCDAERGCFSDECKETGDCQEPTACKTVACNGGKCDYSELGCSNSQECCPSTGECQDCCSNEDCDDAAGRLCCPNTGTCAQCCSDSDCELAMPLGGGSEPQAIVGGGVISCQRPYCKTGVCAVEMGTCPLNQKCCDGLGCVPLLQGCGVMTN